MILNQRFTTMFMEYFAITMFLFVGLITLFSLVLKPILKKIKCSHWHEVKAIIIKNELKSSKDDESQYSYTTDILYQYSYNKYEYTSDKYNFYFPSIAIGNKKTIEKIINQYKPHDNIICYVNPEKPAEAILNKNVNCTIAISGFMLSLAFFAGAFFIFNFFT